LIEYVYTEKKNLEEIQKDIYLEISEEMKIDLIRPTLKIPFPRNFFIEKIFEKGYEMLKKQKMKNEKNLQKLMVVAGYVRLCLMRNQGYGHPKIVLL